MQGCPSAAAAAWTVPSPSPDSIALFHNVNRSSALFLQAAGIEENSEQHKKLKITMRDLHRKHLHPFKYIEEQPRDRIDQLIVKAKLSLPWLNKYQDAWPARVYLKRYVDTKRPHLLCSRYRRAQEHRLQKTRASHRLRPIIAECPSKPPVSPSFLHSLDYCTPVKHDPVVTEFLASLSPGLEHHTAAFAELGINDSKSLVTFLSWPQAIQSHFIDENRAVIRLTSLEKKGLLVGIGHVLQKSLHEAFLADVVEQRRFH